MNTHRNRDVDEHVSIRCDEKVIEPMDIVAIGEDMREPSEDPRESKERLEVETLQTGPDLGRGELQ